MIIHQDGSSPWYTEQLSAWQSGTLYLIKGSLKYHQLPEGSINCNWLGFAARSVRIPPTRTRLITF
jgi:hypothetical protein